MKLNSKAFTLIELIIVIIVLGILFLLAGLKLLNNVDEAKTTTVGSE